MNEQIDHEDTTIGGVTWHCSDEDSGPDVGVSLYLGPDHRLWAGEVSRSLFDEQGKDAFDSDGGWFLIQYCGDETTLVAKFTDDMAARDFIESVAMLAKGVPAVVGTPGK